MSDQDSPIQFPAPIGGTPLPGDLAPSVIFACLFLGLVLLAAYRLTRPASRSIFGIASLLFALERVVTWCLRAKESNTPSEDNDDHLTSYWQVTFTIAYVMLLAKVFTLLRSLVMNALDERLPSDTHALLELRKPDEDPKSRTEVYVEDAGVDTEERARMRRRFMIVFRAVSAAVLLVVILGIVSGNTYTKAETDSGKATLVKVLRQAATVISFLLVLFQHGLLVYVYYTIRRIRRVALLQLFATSAIVIIVPIYHLIIMSNKTTSLTSTERGSQNTSVDKVAFYVLQAAPEFLASAALLSTNVKIMFGMGWFGGRQHAGEA